MSPFADHLYTAALSLPQSERAELATRLWETVDEKTGDAEGIDADQIENEWQEEIQRRVAMIDRGEVELIPDEEVQRRVEAKYGPLPD